LLCGSALPSEQVLLGELLLPGTNPLSAHCTEKNATLQAWGKGCVLTCVLGVVGSDWRCLSLSDKSVAVRVEVFCPKVERHQGSSPFPSELLVVGSVAGFRGQGRMLSCYSRSVTEKLLHSPLHVLVSRSLCFLVLSGQGEGTQRASWPPGWNS